MGSQGTGLDNANHLVKDAKSLIQKIAFNTDDKYGFGTLTCTVYDTAWVALVTKPIDGKKRWLFPESFQYLLDTQSDDGSWSGDTGAQIDGVLNTIAALLVFKRYRDQPLQVQVDTNNLDSRIGRAASSLRSRLASWDVPSSNNVGFEIIVPAMLDLLEKEDASLVFEFKGRAALMNIYKAKMSRFRPDLLYGTSTILKTVTHSLEAFIGQINFDRVSQHKVMGSMFASPSSTAAYLMNASVWDDEAEDYLRYAIKGSIGHGSGGVPGVFPTTHFEYTWVLSTLLRAGFSQSDLDCAELTKMTEILVDAFEKENGAIGLAPGIEPDVDDSAKIITTLNLLGRPIGSERLIEVFEVATHFRVYPGERDASFSANCNALAALLRQPDVTPYSSQIAKIVRFLCDRKWNADDEIKDKWNTSHLYSSLLYVEALVDLLALIEEDKLQEVFDETFITKLCVTLFQACLRPLLDQNSDGSWNHSLEETAYATLILTEARRLRFFDDIREPLQAAIERGITFITSNRARLLNYIWSDKVSYGSPSITEAYVLAALKAASSPVSESVGSSIWQGNAPMHMDKRVKLFHQTPLLMSLPEWELKASLIEALLFQPLLKDPGLEVLSRKDVQGGTYLMMIPFTWTSCNNRTRTHASASHLWEMMALSFFTYQVDEFMEAVVGPTFEGRMDEFRQLVNVVIMAEQNPQSNSLKNSNGTNGSYMNDPKYENFIASLSRCMDFILENPIVQSSSPHDRKILRHELRDFLLAHSRQVEDNLRFGKEIEQQKVWSSATISFFRWVRTIGADHIAGAFCFAYAVCLIGATLTPATCRDCFPTATDKYLAAAACRHLSTMCRMYNDLGSWTRDRDEGNLSSIHFPEFGGEAVDESTKKAVLFGLAQFERACWNDVLRKLEENMVDDPDAEAARLGGRRMRLIQMFFDVTDIYGQIYVLRDISSPIEREMRTNAMAQ
ncbi:aphidicolan-16beta-ol synthase [Xylariaceae sp. FL0662B]|nr:aphidicolan-16beta-ol synthase [Xylariaceae sp. FL0662B]